MLFHKVALVACSNGLSVGEKDSISNLVNVLESFGLQVVISPYLYMDEEYIYNPKRRADILNQMFLDSTIDAIFDVSGGDMANQVLPYLDYDGIKKSHALFFAYSDVTTVINAIFAKTQKNSVLFQIRNLTLDLSGIQKKIFQEYLMNESSLFDSNWVILQGNKNIEDILSQTVVGGNIRCLLKLAGTQYFPDVNQKILFLESLGGSSAQIVTYFAQLNQMDIFNHVNGILLGTFTKLQKDTNRAEVYRLLKAYLPNDLPVFKSEEIGHSVRSKALSIGMK